MCVGQARQRCLFPAVPENAAYAALASLTRRQHGRRQLSSLSRLLLSLFTPILPLLGVTITCRLSPCPPAPPSSGQAACLGPTAGTRTPRSYSPGGGSALPPFAGGCSRGGREVPQSPGPPPSARCTETNFLAFILLENLKMRWHPQGLESESEPGDTNDINLLVLPVSDYFKANCVVPGCQIQGC